MQKIPWVRDSAPELIICYHVNSYSFIFLFMHDITTISTEELKSKIENGDDFILIDVLGDESYNRAHIPTAISIDAHADDFLGRAEEHVPDKDTEIVVYCASPECQLSPTSARTLIDAGYSNVKDYEGGLVGWAQAGNVFEGEAADAMREKLSSKTS